MRSRVSFIAVLVLVVTLGACGDNGTTGKATAPTPSGPATTLSSAQLDKMLLDAGDVGADWQVGPGLNDQDLSDFAQIPCPDSAVNPTIAKRLTPATGVQFEPADHSRKHMIEFLLTGDAQRLDRDLQALSGAMEACSTATSTTSDTGATSKVEKLAIPELGDQRAAYVITVTGSPDSQATWYVRSAVVRVGSVATSLGLTEILPTPQAQPQISDEEFVKILKTAVAKLGG
jgi:hypothetical protein